MAISVQITSATLTEGNSAVSALVPAYTFLRDKSIINYAVSVKWSGASKVTAIETTIEVKNSAGARVGWVLAKEEKTTATSGTKTYTGTLFTPVLSSGYGPGVTSLDDGAYTVEFNFTVWNGSSGTGTYPATTFAITYATLNAPTVTAFDVYRANASGARADDGTYIRYTVQASISKIASTDTGTFTLRYRQSGASSWTSLTLGSNVASVSTTGAALSGTYPISNSYDFELVITDKYTSVTSAKTVPTASVLMHFKADKTGIGIGKYAETSNLLDVNLPTRIRQSLTLDSPLPLSGGGTGANTTANALGNLGIRAGTLTTSVNAGSVKTVTISFSPALPSAPRSVIAVEMIIYTSVTSNAKGISVENFTASSFDLCINRPGGSSATNVTVAWIAVL